jgi:hypothetical protein
VRPPTSARLIGQDGLDRVVNRPGDIGVGQSSLRLAKLGSGEPPTDGSAGEGAGGADLFGGGGGGPDGSSVHGARSGSGSGSESGTEETGGRSGAADTPTRERELAFTLMCSLTGETRRDNVRLLLQNLANAIDEGRASYAVDAQDHRGRLSFGRGSPRISARLERPPPPKRSDSLGADTDAAIRLRH